MLVSLSTTSLELLALNYLETLTRFVIKKCILQEHLVIILQSVACSPGHGVPRTHCSAWRSFAALETSITFPSWGTPRQGMMQKSCSTICLLLWPSECIGLGSPAIEELSPPVPCANSPAVWLKPAGVSKTLGLPSCCSFFFFFFFSARVFWSLPVFSCIPDLLPACSPLSPCWLW